MSPSKQTLPRDSTVAHRNALVARPYLHPMHTMAYVLFILPKKKLRKKSDKKICHSASAAKD